MTALQEGFSFDERQIRMIRKHRPPMLMLDSVRYCSPEFDIIKALRSIGCGEPMLSHDHVSRHRLPDSMVLEALAQTSGLLKTLRWLADKGIDIGEFARGNNRVLYTASGTMMNVPYSVLADSRFSVRRHAHVGDVLEMESRVTLQRQATTRFESVAWCRGERVAQAEITLAFPGEG